MVHLASHIISEGLLLRLPKKHQIFERRYSLVSISKKHDHRMDYRMRKNPGPVLMTLNNFQELKQSHQNGGACPGCLTSIC